MISTNSGKQEIPLHIEAATGAKGEEAVEDPITGQLDLPHWRDKVMDKAEKGTEQES